MIPISLWKIQKMERLVKFSEKIYYGHIQIVSKVIFTELTGLEVLKIKLIK